MQVPPQIQKPLFRAAYVAAWLFTILPQVEAAPPTAIFLSSNTVLEGCPENTVVGTLSATDPDPGDDRLFSLVSGPGSNDNAGFVITGNQLILRFGVSADFEAGPLSLSVRIRATDTRSEIREQVFVITMADDRQEDADSDGLTEAQEEDIYQTSDTVFDSDGDGVGDGAEIAGGTSPKDASVWPATAIVGWGSSDERQRAAPVGSNFVAMATGQNHSLVLGANGTVQAWGGAGSFGQISVPSGLSHVVAVAAGGDFWLKDSSHSLALRDDGTVASWGFDYLGEIVVPADLSGVAAIAAGQSHCLALKTNGTVVAWGHNPHGGVAPPPGLNQVVAISAGGHHSLALRNNGTVVEWGHIFDGSEWHTAAAPAGLCDVVSVSAGRFHDLALRSDGTVVAWGYDSDGQTDVPPGLTNVTAVAAGGFHSLALKSDGSVVAWGSNSHGQAAVPISARSGVKRISAGMYHSLAVLQASGYPSIASSPLILSAPGIELNHQITVANAVATSFAAIGLPDGITVDASSGLIHGTPLAAARCSVRLQALTDKGLLTQIAWLGISSGSPPTSLTLGSTQVIENSPAETVVGVLQAADPDPGETFTFELVDGAGSADNGLFRISGNQLLIRHAITRDYEQDASGFSIRVRARDASLNPFEKSFALQFVDDRSEDADGDGLTEADEEDLYQTSDAHYDTDGDGFGDGFEVDRGSSPNDNLAFPAGPMVMAWGNPAGGRLETPAALNGAADLSAGAAHSLVLKSDGTVTAWGNNDDGQTDVPAGLTGVTAVEAGDFHSLALRGDGTVVAWGNDFFGQATVPVGLGNVVSISAGAYHNLALKRDGTVVAWGADTYGQSTVPAGLTDVVAVAAGGFHSMALKSDGTVVAWGSNWAGVSTVPAGLTGVIAIAAGGYHCLALKNDGMVVAWGSNDEGQTDVPADLTNVATITAGWLHSLVLRTDGTLVSWGGNSGGQVTLPLEASQIRIIDAGDSHNLALRQATGFPAFSDVSPVLLLPGTSLSKPMTVLNAVPTGYSAMGLPAGLTIDPVTGLISGTITTGERRAVRVMASTDIGIVDRVIWFDTADGSPATEITLTAGILPENTPAGTLVGTFAVTDPDAGDSHVLELSYVLDAPDSFRFYISGNQLRLLGDLTADYDAGKTELRFRVIATDPAGNSLARDFVIQMSDVRTEDGDGDGLNEAIEEDVLGTSDAVADNFNDADADGDGVPSLLEYAFNLDPKVPGRPVHLIAGANSTAGLPAIGLVSDGLGHRHLRIEYLRRIGSPLSYTPQFSSNGTSWSTATQPVAVTPINSQWERCVVEDNLFTPGTASRLARVSVMW